MDPTLRRPNQQQTDAARARADSECRIFQNPWPFSFLSRELHRTYLTVENRPAVVYFSNYFWRPGHLLMQTTNHVMGIYAVDASIDVPQTYRISSWTAIQPEAGHITGRIVRASMESVLRKTYEIIIQEGENANNFRAMSVNDGGLFTYITRAMLTGKKMKIYYVRLYRPHAALKSLVLNYATQYRIVAVDLLD